MENMYFMIANSMDDLDPNEGATILGEFKSYGDPNLWRTINQVYDGYRLIHIDHPRGSNDRFFYTAVFVDNHDGGEIELTLFSQTKL